MADEPSTIPAETKPGSTPQEPVDATGTNGGAGRTFTQAELDAAIKERLDRAERKHKEAQDAATRKATEETAKAQGEWQKLAEQYEPKAKRAEALESFIASMLDDELKDVPERVKPIIPAFDDPLKTLEWVRNAKAAGILAKPQPPSTDAASGAGDGRANNAVAAQQRELELWQRMGLNNAVRAVTRNNTTR